MYMYLNKIPDSAHMKSQRLNLIKHDILMRINIFMFQVENFMGDFHFQYMVCWAPYYMYRYRYILNEARGSRNNGNLSMTMTTLQTFHYFFSFCSKHFQYFNLFLTFLSNSLASCVKYGGKFSFAFKILSIVFFLFSAVKGGCKKTYQLKIITKKLMITLNKTRMKC